jgi:uracil DNA glycosylase
MLRSLETTKNGNLWIEKLDIETLEELNSIDEKLVQESKRAQVIPGQQRCLMPFHLISPQKVKLLLICKEPYASLKMATGIPVEIGQGTDLKQTDSLKVFKNFISTFFRDVTDENCMRLFYEAGVLIVNASFTCIFTPNSKYKFSASHFPLWSRFLDKLVRLLNSEEVPILALGSEARMLLRGLLASNNNLYECAFPSSDIESKKEFQLTMKKLFDKYIFPPNVEIATDESGEDDQ